jgi:uncharacterized protein
VDVSPRALGRLLLAHQGLLGWSGRGRHGSGAPWRERFRGAAGVLRVVRALEAVQLDPVNVVERNHHLVLRNRVAGYQPRHLEVQYARHRVFEYWAHARCVLPVERYGELAPRRRLWTMEATVGARAHRDQIHTASDEILRLLAAAPGPLPARALDLGHRVASYWGFATKVSSQALEHLWESGAIVVAERRGDERYYTLAERWLPDRAADAADWGPLLHTFVRAYGVVDAGDPRLGWRKWPVAERRAAFDSLVADGTLTPVRVAGVKRHYAVWTPLVERLPALERARIAPEVFFLAPLDNLLWRRERVLDLFGFDYRWEIYVPDHKRTYGPYVLPVIEGDRFLGRVDARMDRDAARLVLRRAWWQPGASAPSIRRALAGLARLAAELGAELAVPRGRAGRLSTS